MKKLNLLFVLAAFASVSLLFSFSTKADEGVIVETTTIEKLLEEYDGNVMFQDGTSLKDVDLKTEVLLGSTANPCDGETVCNAALAKARAELLLQANECCCVVTGGVICCDPKTGSQLAILFLVTPTNPQCS